LVALATALPPEIPTKRTSKVPAWTRRAWTALPVQLNLRPKRLPADVKLSGKFAMPWLAIPVTTAMPRTAPPAQRGCATAGL
jgi:hypothetical protein